MNIHNLCLSLLVLTLTGFSTLLMLNHNTTLNTTKTITNNKQPDSFMKHLEYSEYNQDGALSMHLTTDKSVHYPYQNSSDLTNPYILIYNQKRIPWYISSKTAHTINNNNIIHLKKHVRFYRPPKKNYPTTTILTSQATIYSEKQYGTTKANTTTLRPGSVTHSKGLTVNFVTNIVDFPSDATSVFQPTHQQTNK